MSQSRTKKNTKTETVASDTKVSKTIIECNNCEHKFEGKFCPNCGQSVKEFEKPFERDQDIAQHLFGVDKYPGRSVNKDSHWDDLDGSAPKERDEDEWE